jgi:predicted HicB family RNase H-like nuclease
MAPKSTHFTLRMDPKLRQAAEQAAAKDHRPLSSLVKKLLSDHCEGQQARTEALPPLKRARK